MRRRVGRDGAAEGGGWRGPASVPVVDLRLGGRHELTLTSVSSVFLPSDDDGGDSSLTLKQLLLNWNRRGAGSGSGGGCCCCLRKLNGNAALSFPFHFPLGAGGNRTTASSSACGSSSNLFVGGLSYDTNETALKDAFSQYGDVIAVKVICHPTTGKSKGFGFVKFSSQNQAAIALQKMNGQVLDGRNIRVHYAIGTGGSAATHD